ncbi:MAG: hypothetical protein M3Q23_18135 [Actinomycetota bacterium]|nr:hypothetical protein [Actinomycetota bacterium]
MASHTVSRSIMFACAENPSPMAWPAAWTHRAPVCTATEPFASTIATCRRSRPSSSARSVSSASSELAPARISSSPRGP